MSFVGNKNTNYELWEAEKNVGLFSANTRDCLVIKNEKYLLDILLSQIITFLMEFYFLPRQ